MADKNTIKNWFKTGLKPTQAQFWATWDSFWHKDEKIPITAIDDIENIMNAKAEAELLTHHLTDLNAHANLFAQKVDKDGLKQLSDENYTLAEKEKLNYLYRTKDIDKPVSTDQASADALVLSDSKEYTNNLITQLKGGTPLDADTLKKINDKVIALQSIVGGTTPDGDTVVNTLTELMAVLTNYPEGTDLFTLVSGKVAKTDIYNALDCVVAGKVADARQLKVLNDLITALTTSVNNKVDKAAGERLINAAEITKLSGLSNVVTTVKTITSASLTTQDISGFVTYINTLGVVLAVGANEIVEYQLSDTGRVFKLLLRGRSFGTGQPAISSADVEEITLWMNKDIKLSNYPSTRNDGQIPTNRILSTDVSGNLKLYTIATAPAPYIEVLIPDSTLPSTTTNFIIKGAFFTPTMTVSIVGQTINYITFVSDNLIKVNVTTGATEGSYSVTLNNGLSATFPNALLIFLGTVFSPLTADWEAPTGNVGAIDDCVKVKIYEVTGSNRWNKQFDYTRNFRVNFKIAKTPYGYTDNNEYRVEHISLVKSSNNATLFSINLRREANGISAINRFSLATGWVANVVLVNASSPSVNMDVICSKNYEFRYIAGIMYFYVDGVLKATFSDPITENLKLKISTKTFDILNIKYIETA